MFDYKKTLKDLRKTHKQERTNIETAKALLAEITVPDGWEEYVTRSSLNLRLSSYSDKQGIMPTVEFRAICDQIEAATKEKFKKRASTSNWKSVV